MSREHTIIPWGPIVPHEVYEGYIAFCQRQRERCKHVDFDRRHQDRRVSNPTPVKETYSYLRDLDKLIGEPPKC